MDMQPTNLPQQLDVISTIWTKVSESSYNNNYEMFTHLNTHWKIYLL